MSISRFFVGLVILACVQQSYQDCSTTAQGCNGNGKCTTQGYCICNTYYSGESCEVIAQNQVEFSNGQIKSAGIVLIVLFCIIIIPVIFIGLNWWLVRISRKKIGGNHASKKLDVISSLKQFQQPEQQQQTYEVNTLGLNTLHNQTKILQNNNDEQRSQVGLQQAKNIDRTQEQESISGVKAMGFNSNQFRDQVSNPFTSSKQTNSTHLPPIKQLSQKYQGKLNQQDIEMGSRQQYDYINSGQTLKKNFTQHSKNLGDENQEEYFESESNMNSERHKFQDRQVKRPGEFTNQPNSEKESQVSKIPDKNSINSKQQGGDEVQSRQEKQNGNQKNRSIY